MGGKKLLMIFAVLFLFLSIPNSFAWLSGFTYRRAIILSGVSSNTNNFQLPLNITYVSGMNSNFSDLRFTDTSDTLRPYWVESKVNGSWAYVWVNISIFNGTIGYLYFGNSSANSLSNGDDVFLFFDDFNYTNNLSSSGKWANITFSVAKAYGYYANLTQSTSSYGMSALAWKNNNFVLSDGSYYLIGWSWFGKDVFPDFDSTSGHGASLFKDSNNFYILSYSTYSNKNKVVNNYRISGSYYNYDWSGTLCDGVFNGYGYFKDLAVVRYDGANLIVNRTFYNSNGTICKINHSCSWVNLPLYFGFITWGGLNVFPDYVFLSKSLNGGTYPTTSFGSVEFSNALIIDLVSPNNTVVFNQDYFETQTPINFSYNITLNGFNITACNLTLSNNNYALTSFDEGVNNYSLNLSFGNYYWNVTCYANGSVWSSPTYSFIINSKPIITTLNFNTLQYNPIIINFSFIDLNTITNNCTLLLNNSYVTSKISNNNTQDYFNFSFPSGLYVVSVNCSESYAYAYNTSANNLLINNEYFTIRVLDENNQSLNYYRQYDSTSSSVVSINFTFNTKSNYVLLQRINSQYPGTFNLYKENTLIFSKYFSYIGWNDVYYWLEPNKQYRIEITGNQGNFYVYSEINDSLIYMPYTTKGVVAFTYGIPFNFNNYTNTTSENFTFRKIDFLSGYLINVTEPDTNNNLINFYNYNYTPNINNFTNETFILNIPKKTVLNITNNTVGLLQIPYTLNISNHVGSKFNINYSEPYSSGVLCYECDVRSDYLTLTNYKYARTITTTIQNNYYYDVFNFTITNYHSNNTLMFYDENTKGLLNLANSSQNTLIMVCDENTTTYNITSQYYNLTINCNNPTLNFYQTYSTTTYYRSLIPEASTTNPRTLNFTMIDLSTTNSIVLTIIFYGLNEGDVIRIYDGVTLLTEQEPDLSGSISFIAIQYHTYTIQLVRNGEARVLGSLVADYSGTKYVNINPFSFGSNTLLINDYVFMTSERTSTYAKITYSDLLNNTNYVYCNFTDVNKNLILENIVYYSNNITFTYTNTTNASLIANCLINHNDFGIIPKSFLFFGNTTEENPIALKLPWLDSGTKKYFALTIIIIIVVLTAVYPKIALLLLSGSLLFFNYFEWFTIPPVILAFIIFFSIIYILLISKKEEGGGGGG